MNRVMIPSATGAQNPGRNLLRGTAVVLCIAALAGCGTFSTVKGWFGNSTSQEVEPAELVEVTPTIAVTQLWSVKAGAGEGKIGARQGPVVANGRVYAAAIEGGITAFDLQTGAAAWHHESELPLSGGPGVGEGVVAAGSLEGDVIALDAATGALKWSGKVGSEVIASPVIGQGMVFVRSNDGRITAFDAASGERRWFWSHDMPTLTVRGNDAPVLGPGYLFVGNDDGTVTALVVADGRELWEQAVAEASGRTELDRMADIDGTPVLDDTILYATSYKQHTMAIDAPSGQPIWSSDSGGVGRAGVASDRIVVSDNNGTVWGIDKASGSILWQQPTLARRNLTSPAIQGDYAVVGDFDGYLHWIGLDTGAFAARLRASGEALRASPVVADGVLVVQDIEGVVSAYRLQ